MKALSLLLLYLLLNTVNIFAQSGIRGVIKDKITGETLIGANIIVDSVANKGASAGIDGDFKINLAPGKYQISISFIGYVTQHQVVEVNKNLWTDLIIVLNQEAVEMEAFQVIETRKLSTEIATVTETKNEQATVNIIGSEEIKKSGTLRNASDVAARIPGVTIMDNRFVMVRGLSERYNAVLINNVFAPSLESDVKTFSFDIIPSQVIERFMIYKSQSPDLPGEFSGGAIKVFTKGIPDQNTITGGYSLGYRNGTTFQPFQSNQGSTTDWLGFDNGYRSLPTNAPADFKNNATQQDLQVAGKSFKPNWSYQNNNANPDQRFNFGYQGLWISKNKIYRFGSISNITYSRTKTHYISNRYDYNIYNINLNQSDSIVSYHDTINQDNANVGALQNFTFQTPRSKFEFKNLLNQSGLNETTLRGGVNYEEGTNRKEYSYRYNQKTFYMGQVAMSHEFGKEVNGKHTDNFDLTIGYAYTKRADPDWRRIRYTNQLGTNDPFSAYIPFSAQPFYLGRLFMNMQEEIKSASGNYEHHFTFNKSDGTIAKFQPSIKTGFYIENKNREFSVRNIGYKPASIFNFDWSIAYQPVDSIFLPENINNVNGLQISEDTKGSDSYLAGNNLRAGYAMINLPFTPRIKFSGGVRLEDNTQFLQSKSLTGDTLIINNRIISALPSINAAYFIIKDTLQLRFAYGKSINRPEFREIAPFAFYDFIFNSIYAGNPDLKTPTINNYDLRLEYYPRVGEMISFGGFYKTFTNPIELYYTPGGGSGGTRSFIYGNAPSAISYGAEMEIRKSLSAISSKQFIKNLSVVINASYIHSEIKLAEETAASDAKRPMMGQSPYIINSGLFYQSDSSNFSVALLYNRVGPRVVIVGIPSIPEVYEMSRNRFDLTISKGIGKSITARLSWQDILNNRYILLQDGNEDGKLDSNTDQIMQSYRKGSYITFGINWTVNPSKKIRKH